jgi:hypothetical protein
VITRGRHAPIVRHTHKIASTQCDLRNRGLSAAIHTTRHLLIIQRPTKARISRLEAENEQLRRHLGSVDAVLDTPSEPAGISLTPPRQGPPDVEKTVADAATDRFQSAVSRIFISPNGDPSYHGLTSTLFDDAPTDRPGHNRSTGPQVPVEHIRKQLMGDAAYQSMEAMSSMMPLSVLTFNQSS